MVVISRKSCKRGDSKVGCPWKNNRKCFSGNVVWVSTSLRPQTYVRSSLLSLRKKATRQTLLCFPNFSWQLSSVRIRERHEFYFSKSLNFLRVVFAILVSLFLCFFFRFVYLFVFRLATKFMHFFFINQAQTPVLPEFVVFVSGTNLTKSISIHFFKNLMEITENRKRLSQK